MGQILDAHMATPPPSTTRGQEVARESVAEPAEVDGTVELTPDETRDEQVAREIDEKSHKEQSLFHYHIRAAQEMVEY